MNNDGKYLEGKLLGIRTLFYQYTQINNNGPNIIKRKVVRPLEENETVKDGVVQIIEESSE